MIPGRRSGSSVRNGDCRTDGSSPPGMIGHAWEEPDRELSTLGVVARVTRASRTRGHVAAGELLFTGVYSRVAFEGEVVEKDRSDSADPPLRLGWGEDLPLPGHLPARRERTAFRDSTSESAGVTGR